MRALEEIISCAKEKGASDVHISEGKSYKCRVDGRIEELFPEAPDASDMQGILAELTGEKDYCELDLGKTISGVRTRINIFIASGKPSIAIRLLSDYIPKIEDLGLPKVAESLPTIRNGIVLVTGETGSGKSTTLAAVLDRINHTRHAHIITLEDPIEYIYEPDKCIINQRQIGTDTKSYADGLRAILREDPDVILIGEMRDLETIEAALTAAETGHLVFATLHTNSAAGAIDRIVSVFPEGKQRQIRLQLSLTLRCVLAQQLIPCSRGGRVAAVEVMVVNGAIANLIREAKTPQIDSFITMGAKDGSVTLDNALKALISAGKISRETALSYCRDVSGFKAF